MFTCQCLNVSINVNDENFLNTSVQATLKSDTGLPRRPVPTGGTATAGFGDGKSRELVCFFQEAIGPLQEANVNVQLSALLKTIRYDEWDVSKCLNCSCLVFARETLKNPSALLVNASLATTAEIVSRRMAQEHFSRAYRIILDGCATTDFRGIYRKDEYRSLFNAAANTLDSTNDRNELLVRLRAFMCAETQLANERIARFTHEQNEQLSNMRDRAEQDYLFLAQTFVPELVDNKRGEAASAAVASGGGTGVMHMMQRINSGGDRRMEEGGDEKALVDGSQGTVPAKALAQLMTNATTASGGGAGGPPSGQMETPPPTPECMPMSTGNSPPSMLSAVNGGGTDVGCSTESSAMSTGGSKKENSRASSISSNSFASDGPEAMNGASLRSKSTSTNNTMRPALSNSAANTINNNTTNQGAINKPPTQQQQQQQQHSTSTNLFANHNSGLASAPGVPGSIIVGSVGSLMGAHRFSNSSGNTHMLDSDCLFDIDGMENDKTPPPDTYSDEEDCDYTDTTDNNNQEGGMYIPRNQYRQNSSIARSLPISTPKPMTLFRGNDDDLDEMNEDNVDIAASIKALAKSVHGDAVFGDLPRPRVQTFTSQI